MKTYLDQLPELNSIVFSALNGILREPEAIESRSRDGFIPCSTNHGGFKAIGFISAYTALETNSERGVEDANRMRSQAYDSAKEDYKGTVDDSGWDAYVADYEDEYLAEGCEQMLSVRFIYHGKEDSKHTATVDVMVNWEAPYFRAGKGMSDFKEVELEWETNEGLNKKLNIAVKELVKLFGRTNEDSY